MPRLGEILVAQGACSEEQVRQGLENQVIFGGRLGTNLLELGAVTEERLAHGLGKRHGRPCLFGNLTLDPVARQLLTAELVDRLEVVPYLSQDRKLAVLVCNPDDLGVLDEIAFATGKQVHPIVVPEARMWVLMRRFYRLERQLRGIDVPELSPRRKPRAAPEQRGKEDVGQDLMDEAEFESLYGRLDSPARPAASMAPPAPGPPAAAAPPSSGAGPVPDEVVVDLTDEVVEPLPAAGASREEVLRALAQEADGHAPSPSFTPPRPMPAVRLPDTSPLGFVEAVRFLEGVADRDAIAQTVLRYARSRFKRAVLLTVQREMALGWEGLGEGLDRQAVGRVRLGLGGPGAIETVVRSRAHFLGPLQKTEQNLRFLKSLGGGAPRNAFVLPILALGRVVNVLYVDNGRGGLVDASDVGELLILATKIAQSYDTLVRRAV